MESTSVDKSSVPAPAPPTTASIQTTNIGPYTSFCFCSCIFFLPFASLFICFIFFLDSITPQTEESSDAPHSVMIISPPSVKDQERVGSTSEALTPISLKISYKILLLL
jgi:hypothetical protein